MDKSKKIVKRDTTINWSLKNPILSQGQIGFDIMVGKYKIGDGSTAWNDLDYFIKSFKITYFQNKKITVYFKTTMEWNANPFFISEDNAFYLYLDYQILYNDDNNEIGIIGIKKGDGKSYLIDLPFTEQYDDVLKCIHNKGKNQDYAFWKSKKQYYLPQDESIMFIND